MGPRFKILTAALFFLFQAGLSSALANYSDGTISVSGGDYTLQSLYAELNNSGVNDSVFYYDNVTRTAVLSAVLNLSDGGELYVSNETLLVNSTFPGQYFISVSTGFHLNGSSNLTAADPAYPYYVVVNGGSIKMQDSYLSFAGYELGDNGNRSGMWLGTNVQSIITGSVFSNNYVGLFLLYAYNINFSNNRILSSNSTGVYLESTSSYSNFILNNSISGSPIGIYLNDSGSNTLSYNSISASAYGLYINFSNSNTLSSNNVSAPYGVYMESSSSNTFSYSNFSSPLFGVYSSASLSNFFFSSRISPVYLNNSDARFEGSSIGNVSLYFSSAIMLASNYSSITLDDYSNVTRQWHPPLYVRNHTSPIEGANFSATDWFGNNFSALSDAGGRLFWNATHYFQNSTGNVTYNPYGITVFRGPLRFMSPYYFESESEAVFYLIPPGICLSNISVLITRQNVTVSANASDPLNISSLVAGIRRPFSAEANYSMLLVSGSAANGSYEYNFSASSLGTHSVWIYANNSQDSRASLFAGTFEVRNLSFRRFNLSDSLGQYDNILNVNDTYRFTVNISEFNGSAYLPVSAGGFNVTVNGTDYPLEFDGRLWRSASEFNFSGSAGAYPVPVNISGFSGNGIPGSVSAQYSYRVRSAVVSLDLSAALANQNGPINVSGRVSYFNGSAWFNSSNASVGFWVSGSFAGSTVVDANGTYNFTLSLPCSAGLHQIVVNATDPYGITASNASYAWARLLVENISAIGVPSGTVFVTQGTLVNVSAFVHKSPFGNITSVVAFVSGNSSSHAFQLSNASGRDESGWWSGALNVSGLSGFLGDYNVTVLANESTNLTQQVPPPYSSFRVQNISLPFFLEPSTASPGALVRIYGRAALNPDGSGISNRLLYFYADGGPLLINDTALLAWDRNVSWGSGVFENSTYFNGSVVMNNTQAFFRDNLSLLSSSANITFQGGARVSRAGDSIFSFDLSKKVGSLSWGNSSLWHADNFTKRVYRFNANGSPISNFSLNSSITPTGIAYDSSSGLVWVSDAVARQLYNFSSNGTLYSNHSIPNGTGISLAHDGTNLWTSYRGGWLFRLTPDGTYVSNISANASNITGIAWDGAYLFYLDPDSSLVHRMATNGTELSGFPAPNGNRTAFGLAWDGSYLWVASNFTGRAYQTLTETAPYGNLTSPPISPGHPLVWGSFSVSEHVPNGTNVSYLLLDSLTGAVLCDLSNNTDISGCANSTSVLLFANLAANGTASPVIYNWSLSWAANYSGAAYFSNTTAVDYPIIFVSPVLNVSLFEGSGIVVEFSVNNGSTWHNANRTYNWTPDFSNRYFRYRAFFNTSNSSVSSRLNQVFFGHRIAPRTDINGSFNYTFASPLSYGEYAIKANLTDQNGVYGEGSQLLLLPAPPPIFVVGPSTPVMAQTSEQLSELRIYPEQTATIPVTMEGAAVTEFLVSVKKMAINVLISVKRLAELPEDVQPPGGSVYRYLEFSKANLDDDIIRAIAVRFKVENSWLSSNDLNRSSVHLMRYSGGKWAKISAFLYKFDERYSYYESDLPGFSIFAVRAERNFPPPPPPSPPPPPQEPPPPPPPPILRQRDIDIALERFYSLNDTVDSGEARTILYQAFDKLALAQKAFSAGNLSLAKDLLSQAELLMNASANIRVAKVETPTWYYAAPALILLLLIGFAYRNMRTQLPERPDISALLGDIHNAKQALSQLESDYLENKIDPDTYRMKRAQIKSRIEELKTTLNNIQQAGAK